MSDRTRPPWYLRLLARLLPARDREFVLGDLQERLSLDEERVGRRRARLRYIRGLLRSAASGVRGRLTSGFGGRLQTRRVHVLDELLQDARHGVRQIRRSPGFAMGVVVTLALALGASASVFSVLEGVLLRPLPYAQPDRLVAIWARFLPESGYDLPQATLTGPEVLDLQTATQTLSSVGVIQGGASIALSGDGVAPEETPVWLGSASLLPTLGVDPLLGRWFTSDEDVPGGAAVAVITHALWASRYGSDPGVVGQVVTMSGTPTEVVGVLPPGFTLGLVWTRDIGAYLPLRLTRTSAASGHAYGAIGRLAAGEEPGDLEAELGVINERWSQDGRSHGDELWARPLKEDRLANTAEPLLLLAVAVGLVLVVACVNVAGLLLTRGERRHGEVAVRTALGADRWRVVRQLLTESTVLAVGALLVAIPLAWLGTEAVIRLDPTALPRLRDVSVGRTAFAFTAGGTVLAILLFGLVPALVTFQQAGAALGSAPGWTGSGAAGRLRPLLVGAEVAVSVTVVIIAGVLARSMWERSTADPGFRIEGVMAFDLALPEERYPDDRSVPVAYQTVVDRLSALPGVASVSAASAVSFGEHMLVFPFRLDGRPPRQENEPAWSAVTNFVLPGYFETMGIPIDEGRGLTGSDRMGTPAAAVVNATMARTFWPGESAIGQRLTYSPEGAEAVWVTVVGVVSDQVRAAVGEAAMPQVYLSQFQSASVMGRTARDVAAVVRVGIDAASLLPQMRAVVQDFDPGLPVGNPRMMTDAFSASMARPRLLTYLFSIFGAITLILAVVGLYGVVSYSVAGRTMEIGVRVALGATRARVLGMVTAEGSIPLALGVAIGVGAAWLTAPFLQGLLYEVPALDSISFLTIPLAFLVVGIGAMAIPAFRAASIGPHNALRDE